MTKSKIAKVFLEDNKEKQKAIKGLYEINVTDIISVTAKNNSYGFITLDKKIQIYFFMYLTFKYLNLVKLR